jgi:hypothetical protein
MMLRSVFVCGVVLAAFAGPALAANTCVQPFAPAIVAGAKATKEQMLTAQTEVREFLRASDQYQECILRDLQLQRAEAARDQKQLDPAVVDAGTRRIQANQREKERVGAEYNAAVKAYAAAHP